MCSGLRKMLETAVFSLKKHIPPAPLPLHLPGMDEYFGGRLGVDVRGVQLETLAHWQQPLESEAAPRCAMTFGVALRQLH